MSSSEIRVAHLFSTRFGQKFSGHEKRWIRQLRAWSDRSVAHRIVTPRGVESLPPRELSPSPAKPGWPDSGLHRTLLTVKRILDNTARFDILHIHGIRWAGLLAAPVCRTMGKVSLVELGFLGADNPSALRSQKLGWLQLALLRRQQGLLCISRAIRNDCLNSGFPAETVRLIVNPVDTGIFFPDSQSTKSGLRAKYGYPAGVFLILCVASIKHRKGIDVLVEVMKRSQPLTRDSLLVVVGPNSSATNPGVDDAFVDRMMTEVRSAGMESRVHFVGQIDDDAVLADHYRLADVSVLPSRAEGLGNVILESMAVGTPVVASLLPGITDTVVEQGVDGYLVPSEDVEGFLSRLSFLEQHTDEARAMGERAQAKIVRSFGLKAWETRLVELYRSLLR